MSQRAPDILAYIAQFSLLGSRRGIYQERNHTRRVFQLKVLLPLLVLSWIGSHSQGLMVRRDNSAIAYPIHRV